MVAQSVAVMRQARALTPTRRVPVRSPAPVQMPRPPAPAPRRPAPAPVLQPPAIVLTLRPPAEVTEMGLASLTGLDAPPVGALEQNIFYVNQVMQFGKLLAVLRDAVAPARAIASSGTRKVRSTASASSR